MSSVLNCSGVKESPVFPLLQVEPRESMATLCARMSVYEIYFKNLHNKQLHCYTGQITSENVCIWIMAPEELGGGQGRGSSCPLLCWLRGFWTCKFLS